MCTPIVIFGIGTFASVISGYLGECVHAYTVDREYCRGIHVFNGCPVISFDDMHHVYPPSHYQLIIAVTQQNGHRSLLCDKVTQAKDRGYKIATFVHPSAYVYPNVQIGEGCIISPGAIVESSTKLGICTFIRSGAYVGHHCDLGNFVYVAPRASMSGHVTINDGVFIGNNATLRDRITIGENAIVGAGAVVLRHVKSNEVYKAMEARLLSIDAREVKI